MKQRKSPKQLSKFITYVLGRRPDEFGLVPDPNGFVKIKELLKAIREEDDWKYVRRSHIDEILITLPNPLIEINDNFIRAKHRNNLPEHTLSHDLPKLLYTSVRRKAYPFVLDKGIFPLGYSHVILSSSRDLAERMGKRLDPLPVLLTILVQKSVDNGVVFYQAGESIFISESIPAGCFTGPPLPKQKQESKKQDIPEKQKTPKLPGSFVIDLKDDKKHKKLSIRKKKKKEIEWKKNRKKLKKQKNWPDF